MLNDELLDDLLRTGGNVCIVKASRTGEIGRLCR